MSERLTFKYYSRTGGSPTFWGVGHFDATVTSPGPEPEWIAAQMAAHADHSGEFIVVCEGYPGRAETAFRVNITESGYEGQLA